MARNISIPTILVIAAILFSLSDYYGFARIRFSPFQVDSLCRQENPNVIVYNRIPKAGSTTLMSLIQDISLQNGVTVVTPLPHHDHARIRQAIFNAIESGNKTVIINHFFFPEVFYSNKISYINMLRDPVDRIVSEYYYMRLDRRYKNRGERYRLAHGNLSIETCIFGQHNYTGACLGKHNAMIHYFCGMESNHCHEDEEELLREGKQNLQSHYIVGVIEDLRESLRVFEAKFPSFFHGITRFALRNENSNSKNELSNRVKSFLRRANAYDYEIYETEPIFGVVALIWTYQMISSPSKSVALRWPSHYLYEKIYMDHLQPLRGPQKWFMNNHAILQRI